MVAAAWGRLRARIVDGRRRPGVNVVGYLDAASGLGERARELVATLRAGGVPVREYPVDPSDRHGVATGDPRVPYDTTIAMVTAVQLASVLDSTPEPFDGADRTIGYFFWELADVPADHSWGIGLVDEIWAPTRFVVEAYRAATRTPVRHVPLPLPRPPGAAVGNGTPSGSELDVLVAFDFASVMERKHPLGAIEAFRRAFPGQEDVRLILKTLNGDRRPEQLQLLRDAIRDDDRITIRDERCSADAMAELTASADVMLSLHRSEGLGLHLAEAMALGTLVVASRYGGNLDVMDDDCAALVDVELVEVRNGEGAYEPPAVWADPDLDQAAALLRRAHEDRPWREQLTARAIERIASSPSRAEIGATLAAVLR